MKAVILAGGLGTRLQPYTFFIPKPMLPLGNKPLLEHIIDWLKTSSGERINNVVLCVSYLHRTIEDYFEDGSRFGIKIEYARSERPLATAGQLKSAQNLIHDTFVCLYGDSIYEFGLGDMIHQHIKSKAFISMALLSYRTKEPANIKKKEGSTIYWGITSALVKNRNAEIIYHDGDIGKEPMIMIFGRNPTEVFEKIKRILYYL